MKITKIKLIKVANKNNNKKSGASTSKQSDKVDNEQVIKTEVDDKVNNKEVKNLPYNKPIYNITENKNTQLLAGRYLFLL